MHIRVVFYHQHVKAIFCLGPGWCPFRLVQISGLAIGFSDLIAGRLALFRYFCRYIRQGYSKYAPLARGTFYCNGAAQALGQLFGQGQAYACAPLQWGVGLLALVKAVKNMGQVGGGNAPARVTNGQQQAVIIAGGGSLPGRLPGYASGRC